MNTPKRDTGKHKPISDQETQVIGLVNGRPQDSAENKKQITYFACFFPEGKAQDLEIPSPDAKVNLPEGCHGYTIKKKQVVVEVSDLSRRVYVGREYTKPGIEKELSDISEKQKEIESRKKTLDKLLDSMTRKSLDRFVQTTDGKYYALTNGDKVISPEEYKKLG